VSAGRAELHECGESRVEAEAVQFDAAWWSALPLGRGVELVAHDVNGVAALCKSAGLLSHPNAAGDEVRSLIRAPYDLKEECYWCGSENEAKRRRVYLLNRLDSATSGVLLVCANRELALKIRQRFRERAVHKVYAALVFGKLGQAQSGGAKRGSAGPLIWRDRLSIEKRGGQIRTKAATGVRLATNARASGGAVRGEVSAETRVKPLRVGQDVSLLQLEPLTGRSHQLRVQCARRGLPIVGDATYGDFAANRAFAKAHHGTRGRLFLHSLETRFDYDWRGRKVHFAACAPLPKEFTRLSFS